MKTNPSPQALSALNGNQQRFDRIVLLRDLKDLVREQKHLNSKAHERPLNAWETSRLGELVNEIGGVIKAIAAEFNGSKAARS